MVIESEELRARSEVQRAKDNPTQPPLSKGREGGVKSKEWEVKSLEQIAKSEEHRAMSKEQKIKSSRLLDKSKGYETLSSMLSALCFVLIVVGGCASLQQQGSVLAVVNGEPITEHDLQYSLQIAHRREDLSSAGALNLSHFIQKLIDDRLIIQEARRMGAEDYPEVQQAIQAYILRESVVRLHNEEIVRKVTVMEDDMRSYYKKNYEQFSLGLIEVDSEEKAQEILEEIKKGSDFGELARKHSTNPSQKDGGEIVLRRNSFTPMIEKAISNLKP